VTTHVGQACSSDTPRILTGGQPPPTSSTARPRLEALTGLRWIAAFGVFLFHVREFYPLPGMRDVALFGNSGVTFFFILSGFVLTWSSSPQDTALRFYWRRFARIWPALAVSTALAIPVFYTGAQVAFDTTQRLGVLASLALVQAWIPQVLFSGNPAAWSLSDEAFFYALFPLAVRPLVRCPGWLLALLAGSLVVAQGMVRLWAWEAGPGPDAEVICFVSPPGRVGEFLLGMVIAVAMRRGWRCRVPVWMAAAATVAGVAGLWLCQTHPNPYLPGDHAQEAMNQVMSPFFALLIAAVAGRDALGRPMLLRSRPLVALGTWSYSFYLVHATVLYWLVRNWMPEQRPSWDNWLPATVSLIAGLAVAVILYTVVEHPCEKALRRLPGGAGRRNP
jgi:peptidoglycan/LPS O-acetylase OafA/YrhL